MSSAYAHFASSSLPLFNQKLITRLHQITPDVCAARCFPGAIFVKIPRWKIGTAIGGGAFCDSQFANLSPNARAGRQRYQAVGDDRLPGLEIVDFCTLFSSFAGAIIGVAAMIIKTGYKIRCAIWPVLSAAAVAYIFWGDDFMRFLVLGY